jgi:accessory gene regulator B
VELNNDSERVEIYTYGLELILSTILTICLIVSVSLLLGLLSESIIFMAFFAVLRMFAGGYHAPTYLNCLFMFTVLCFGTIYVAIFLTDNLYNPVVLILFILCLSIVIIFFLAPVSSESKPLSTEEVKRYQKNSRMIVVSLAIITVIIFVIILNQINCAFVSSGALLIEALTLLPFFNKEGTKDFGKIKE